MTPLQETLFHIGPDARIISVEVDEHEHRDTIRCEISGEYLVPEHQRQDGDGLALVPVARIVFIADGYDPDGEVLSETDNEWVPTSRAVIREALEMQRADIKARPVTDSTVSERGAALRAVDDVFDSLAGADLSPRRRTA